MAGFELPVELPGRRGGGEERLRAAPRLLAHRGVVADLDPPPLQAMLRRAVVLGCVDIVERARQRLLEQRDLGIDQKLPRAVASAGDMGADRLPARGLV